MGNNASRGRGDNQEVSRHVSYVGNEAGTSAAQSFYCASHVTTLSSNRVHLCNRGNSTLTFT